MIKGVLVQSDRDPLGGYSKESLTNLLRIKLSGRVLEAWTFGSFNTAEFSRHSDIDLILIKETDTSFPLRGAEFFDLQDITRMDILVYTPEEFRKQLENTTGFWKTVKETLTRIV